MFWVEKFKIAMIITEILPSRLKELLVEAEITPAILSKKLNIEQSVISKFLLGERLPSANTLVKLSDFFNITTDYLLGLSDVLDNRKFKERPPFNEQFEFLLSNFNKTKYRLGKDAEFSEETLNRWQKGQYEPTVESLARLAKYFDCSVDFVLGREV